MSPHKVAEPVDAATDLDTRRHVALGSTTRRRILDVIAAGGGTTSIADIADAVRLHANTVRAHLDVLEEAELVRGSVERSGRRGRPRQVYAVTGPIEVAAAPLGDLRTEIATALLSGFGRHVADAVARAQSSAEHIGRSWGSRVAVAEHESGDAVSGCLAAAGVEVVRRPDGAAVVRTCPLADLARLRPEVVCPLHASMLTSALSTAAGVEHVAVEPGRGGACVIHGLPGAA